jgi:hypothetical protein
MKFKVGDTVKLIDDHNGSGNNLINRLNTLAKVVEVFDAPTWKYIKVKWESDGEKSNGLYKNRFIHIMSDNSSSKLLKFLREGRNKNVETKNGNSN